MPSPIRLNKVLKELNISLDRAVEFLSSKKIEIEPRPTSKIDQDIYNLLLDEFQTDKSDKDKLEEINTKKRKATVLGILGVSIYFVRFRPWTELLSAWTRLPPALDGMNSGLGRI